MIRQWGACFTILVSVAIDAVMPMLLARNINTMIGTMNLSKYSSIMLGQRPILAESGGERRPISWLIRWKP